MEVEARSGAAGERIADRRAAADGHVVGGRGRAVAAEEEEISGPVEVHGAVCEGHDGLVAGVDGVQAIPDLDPRERLIVGIRVGDEQPEPVEHVQIVRDVTVSEREAVDSGAERRHQAGDVGEVAHALQVAGRLRPDDGARDGRPVEDDLLVAKRQVGRARRRACGDPGPIQQAETDAAARVDRDPGGTRQITSHRAAGERQSALLKVDERGERRRGGGGRRQDHTETGGKQARAHKCFALQATFR